MFRKPDANEPTTAAMIAAIIMDTDEKHGLKDWAEATEGGPNDESPYLSAVTEDEEKVAGIFQRAWFDSPTVSIAWYRDADQTLLYKAPILMSWDECGGIISRFLRFRRLPDGSGTADIRLEKRAGHDELSVFLPFFPIEHDWPVNTPVSIGLYMAATSVDPAPARVDASGRRLVFDGNITRDGYEVTVEAMVTDWEESIAELGLRYGRQMH